MMNLSCLLMNLSCLMMDLIQMVMTPTGMKNLAGMASLAEMLNLYVVSQMMQLYYHYFAVPFYRNQDCIFHGIQNSVKGCLSSLFVAWKCFWSILLLTFHYNGTTSSLSELLSH